MKNAVGCGSDDGEEERNFVIISNVVAVKNKSTRSR